MTTLKKRIKAFLGYLLFATRLHKLLLRDRAVIVAFHRITDSPAGSALNCSPAIFARFCRFFGKHFSVVPLRELLDALRRNQPIGSRLVITFDDGYKDNYELAAPVLKRYGLPATFFVATNFVGSRTVPFWDAEDGYRSEWMTWNDVVGLHRSGFDVGGHTLNHADLGTAQLADAEREISGCREVLRNRLGVEVPHFAYPFGSPEHIRAETRVLVAAAGFECCLSCHGGVVTAADDPFDLRREPINTWSLSPYQYGFELVMKVREGRA